MTNKINQINLDLPALDMSVKTMAIHEWMQSLLEEVDSYKTLHLSLLEAVTPMLHLAFNFSGNPVPDDVISSVMSILAFAIE